MRTIYHRIAAVLFIAGLVAGVVFALGGNHPSWMMATFWLTLGGIISTAVAISSP